MLENSFSVFLQVAMLFSLCAFIYMIVSLMFKDVLKKKKKVNEGKKGNEAALVILDAANPSLVNQKIPFTGQITIGRSAGNVVVLDDKFASHYHAVITQVSNRYEIEDLNSRNHTYVNDVAITGKQYLNNGDIIKIGRISFRFEG